MTWSVMMILPTPMRAAACRRAEVARAMPYNEKADVHSFGLVLWEACSVPSVLRGSFGSRLSTTKV